MSNEQRDELAKVLQAAAKAPCPISFWSRAYSEPTGYGEIFADAILAAGYVKLEPLWAETLENDGTYENTCKCSWYEPNEAKP